jgi:hypothetical protein
MSHKNHLPFPGRILHHPLDQALVILPIGTAGGQGYRSALELDVLGGYGLTYALAQGPRVFLLGDGGGGDACLRRSSNNK